MMTDNGGEDIDDREKEYKQQREFQRRFQRFWEELNRWEYNHVVEFHDLPSEVFRIKIYDSGSGVELIHSMHEDDRCTLTWYEYDAEGEVEESEDWSTDSVSEAVDNWRQLRERL